jgi:hypothetical protein
VKKKSKFKVFTIVLLVLSTSAANLQHPYGNPIIINSVDSDGNLNLNFEALKNVLLQDEVKDRKIVIISVLGAYRSGKSFFLGYCLRYLYANVSHFRDVCKLRHTFNGEGLQRIYGSSNKILFIYCDKGSRVYP